MDDNRSTQLTRQDILLAGMISIVITVVSLVTKSFWGDEIFSLEFASASGLTFIDMLAADYHPPLYFLLLKLWVNVWGDSEIALRAFQGVQVFFLLLFSLLLFRRFFPKTRYHTAWVILAFSSELWLFAPMLRYYTLAAVLVVASSLLVLEWLSSGRRSQAILLAVTYTALLYTDYPASVVIVLHLLYTSMQERRRVLAHLGISAAAGVFFLPWAIILLGQLRALVSSPQVADLNSSVFAIAIKIAYCSYAFLFGETVFPFELAVIAAIVFATVGVVIGLPITIRDRRLLLFAGSVIVGGVITTALITTFLSTHTSFIYSPARTFFALPFVFLILGGILQGMRRPAGGYIVLAMLLLINLYGTVNWALGRNFLMPVYAAPWKEVIREVQGTPGLILVDESSCYEYYRERSHSVFPRRIAPESIQELNDEIQAQGQGRDTEVAIILTGRESTQPEIPEIIIEHLKLHGAVLSQKRFVVVDAKYRALKAKILKRDSYDAKITITTYKLPSVDDNLD